MRAAAHFQRAYQAVIAHPGGFVTGVFRALRGKPVAASGEKDQNHARETSAPHKRRVCSVTVRFLNVGASPSGKAPVFGTGIRRFESSRPSQFFGNDQAVARRLIR